ncbi:MAG: CoA-binding protein [Alphaproteobacteria bacterium]|nr:CoA-binding protein [Alphaproteobacteria bacterium]
MPEPHRLTPLLAPRSIALVGASPREGTLGHDMLRVLRRGGYRGQVLPINPKYDRIAEWPCQPALAALGEPPDLAVLAVANARLEEALIEAIAAKAKAAVIFASGYVEHDRDPPLLARLAELARGAGLPLCGANCMGFYNLDAATRVCGFYSERDPQQGGITLITHSGSVFSCFSHNDRRYGYNLVVSSGQEIATTIADYMDYALEQPTTRVIGLFLETVRDVPGFIAAVEKARMRRIPVVALKVGATPESARLAATHSGAIAGDDGAYEALFDRYGVVRVGNLDELGATLLLLGQPRRVAQGGLAAMLDSGGERGMMIDLAEQAHVPFARLAPATTARLAERLDFGLEPVNPLDAWGTGHDHEAIFRDCFAALTQDPDTGIAGIFTDIRDSGFLCGPYERVARAAFAATDKPIVVAPNFSGVAHDEVAVRLTRDGIPVLDGTQNALAAIRHALWLRDHWARPHGAAIAPPAAAIVRHWRDRLAASGTLEEAESLALIADFGIPAQPTRVVDSVESAYAVAEEFGYPVALKTAKPGVTHKSEVDGVRLGLADAGALVKAYVDLSARLGRRMVIAPMASAGVELAFGMVRDPQFGPLVMVGAGGTLIEVLRDRAVALAPFDAAEARRLLNRLAIRRLLDGVRGKPPADIGALAAALARFSLLAAVLGDAIAELDVNPIIAGPEACVAVDALVVARRA